jgi:hypothetical protein
MSYSKIFTSVLLLSSFSIFAQVEEPVKNEKKANTSNAKPAKPSQTAGAKPLKVSKPTQSAGQRVNKSTSTK